MTTPLKRYYFHAYGMTSEGEHGDDGTHTYYVRFPDLQSYVAEKVAEARKEALEEAARQLRVVAKMSKDITYDNAADIVEGVIDSLPQQPELSK